MLIKHSENAVNQKDKDKLIKSLNLLSSDYDGEIVSAAKAAVRILNKNGISFNDIFNVTVNAENNRPANPYSAANHAATWDAYYNNHAKKESGYAKAGWSKLALMIRVRKMAELTGWEQTFIESIIDRSYITDKQWSVLHRIAVKTQV